MAVTFAEIEQKLLLNAQTESLSAFVSEAAQDQRIDEAAQRSLGRLSVGEDRGRMAATLLAAAVRSEIVAGIMSDAATAYTLPEGTNAVLTTPSGIGAAPTVVYRGELSNDPDAPDSPLAGSLNGAWNVLPGENAV